MGYLRFANSPDTQIPSYPATQLPSYSANYLDPPEPMLRSFCRLEQSAYTLSIAATLVLAPPPSPALHWDPIQPLFATPTSSANRSKKAYIPQVPIHLPGPTPARP